ncbi:phage baseplate plug family protein [Frateuria aurantia]|uniref:Cyanophage baseplate Pam3 plug gp18 domain-containing protein n=1 Tax=Frateuria aurantia (strain ATCC 33424 / DSM 6220 / KCTC 2777 / LMG 1558 / NBRC 3245 / NCIMB 13370) TaxID=767434 RepID=H8L679_FRAAD|nr:hypothetical protein [Frateuria aurantia]AFC85923.1 hypothetical protein Fraau_1503 [Frateuria aurantia DSM 6220]
MAKTVYQIPLDAAGQTIQAMIGSVQYQLTVQWRKFSGWVLDIASTDGTALVSGIPLVTGVDLLGQYGYLGIGGSLLMATNADPDAVPTYENLGTTSNLYFVVTS